MLQQLKFFIGAIVFLIQTAILLNPVIAATISGTVTLDTGGHPPQNSFTVYVKAAADWMTSGCDAWGGFSSMNYNSDNGQYQMTIDAGTYYLVLNHSADVNLVNEWSTGPSVASSPDCTQATKLVIGVGDALTGYNFQVAPGAVAEGYVKDEDGNALSGVQINSYVKVGTDGCSYDNTFAETGRSDALGHFSVVALPLGTTYYFKADPFNDINYIAEWYHTGGSAPDCAQASPVYLNTTTPQINIGFSLDAGSIIRGTVRDENGTPLQGIGIYLRLDSTQNNPCWGSWYKGWPDTDNNGKFTIIGIPPGTYVIHTDSQDYINEYWGAPVSVQDCSQADFIVITTENEEHSGKDFSIELGSSISGYITDADGPVTGMQVSISQDQSSCSSPIISPVYTEADGKYTIDGVPRGQYIIAVEQDFFGSQDYANEYWDNTFDQESATPIIIDTPGQNVTGINLELDASSTITGTITGYSSTSDLTGLQVYAYDSDKGCLSSAKQGSINSTDGTYIVKGLAPGNYHVRVKSWGSVNFAPAWSVGATSVESCDQLSGSIALPSPGSNEYGINVQLQSGSTITGTVSREDGATVNAGDFIVYLVDRSAGDPCSLAFPFASDSVDQGGAYSIAGLPPGTYSIRAEQRNYADTYFVSEWVIGSSSPSDPDCSQAESITITASGEVVSNRDLQLAEGGSISGNVFNSDEVTRTEKLYFIRCHTSCDTNLWTMDSPSLCGSYNTPALEPATYYLSLTSADRNTFLGWLSPTGHLVRDCSAARQVSVDQRLTTQPIDFILDPDQNPFLNPIYLLLLNN